MSVRILEGDCRDVLPSLPEGSVHAVVTSPPYWKKREYGGGSRQIGQEGTVEEYVAALDGVFREVSRVLRLDGTLWLNLGDPHVDGEVVPESWLTALALQRYGWQLKQAIIWDKPNAKPESARNRPGTSHEYVFLFGRSARAYYDREAVREETHHCRSVWKITKPSYHGAHTAVMPVELASRCIAAGTPEGGVCGRCGTPFARVLEVGDHLTEQQRRCGGDASGRYRGQARKEYEAAGAENASDLKRRILDGMRARKTVGWRPTCDCWPTCVGCQTCSFAGGHYFAPLEVKPAVVLDPFAGTGTTGVAANLMGRDAILIELGAANVRLTQDRTSQGGLL